MESIRFSKGWGGGRGRCRAMAAASPSGPRRRSDASGGAVSCPAVAPGPRVPNRTTKPDRWECTSPSPNVAPRSSPPTGSAHESAAFASCPVRRFSGSRAAARAGPGRRGAGRFGCPPVALGGGLEERLPAVRASVVAAQALDAWSGLLLGGERAAPEARLRPRPRPSPRVVAGRARHLDGRPRAVVEPVRRPPDEVAKRGPAAGPSRARPNDVIGGKRGPRPREPGLSISYLARPTPSPRHDTTTPTTCGS